MDLHARIRRVGGLGDDPLLEDYENLREKDLAVRRQAFIAESEVVLRVLLERGRFPVRSVLLAETRLDKVAPILEAADPDLPIFVAEQAVLDAVVGFAIHRGILAAGQRLPVPSAEQLLDELGEQAQRVVVLEGLTNHDNVGGVFRNAAAFGADAVIHDTATCDPLYRKAIRVSVGGSLVVPFAQTIDSETAVAALKKAGFFVLALSPRPDAPRIDVLLPRLPARVALLLGTEGPGLCEATMGRADAVARIDIESSFDSLNVAAASAIALHQLRVAEGGRR